MGNLAGCGKSLSNGERKDLESKMQSYIDNEKMSGRDPMMYAVQDLITEHTSNFESIVGQIREHIKGASNGNANEEGNVAEGTSGSDDGRGVVESGSIDSGRVPDVQGDGQVQSGDGQLDADGRINGLVATKADNQNYEALDKMLVDPEITLHATNGVLANFAEVTERLQGKLGVKAKTVIVTKAELKDTAFGIYLSELIKRSVNPDSITGGRLYRGLLDTTTGQTFSLAVINDKFASNDLMTQAILSHEVIGHGIFHEFFAKASELMQAKIKADFQIAFSKVKAFGSLEDSQKVEVAKEFFDVLVLKEFGKGLYSTFDIKVDELGKPETPEAYEHRIFMEWTANQITKAVYATEPAKNLVERFWEKIAVEVRKLYKTFKADNLDVVAGVASIREFVDLLYRNQESVENFNVNLKSPYKGLIQSILKEITTVDASGKFTVRPNWLVVSSKAGKTAKSLRKYSTRYLSKDKVFVSESVRSKHAQDSQFSINKIEGGYELVGPVPFTNEKGFVELKPGRLFSITKEQMQGFGGQGPMNSAFYLLQNIRDLLIISDAALAKPKAKAPDLVKGFLQTADGRSIAVKVDKADTFLTEIYQGAVLLAPENDMSSAQMFLHLFTKDFGGVGVGIKGATGLNIPENDVIYDRMERRIKIINKLAPDAVDKLTSYISQNQIVESAPTERLVEAALVEEQIEDAGLPSSESVDGLSAISSRIDELIQNALPKKGKKIDGLKIFDELGWRYMNELSGIEKNYAEAYAKQAIESLIGDEIAVKLKDNVKLTQAEVKFIVGDYSDDLVVSADKSSALVDEEILGSYHDVVDGFDKIIIDDSSMSYKIEQPKAGRAISSIFKHGVRLDDLIDHKSLFKALPRLKEAKVFYYKDIMGKQGWTEINKGIIEFHVNGSLLGIGTTMTLLHEIQHGIQVLEGFAYGASVSGMKEFRMSFDTLDKRWSYLMKKFNNQQLYEHASGEAEARFVSMLYKKGITKDTIGDPLEMLSKLARVDLGDRIYIEPSRVRLSMSESVLLSVPNNASDTVAQAATELMYDDLAIKRRTSKLPPIVTEGPYAGQIRETLKAKKKREAKLPDPLKIKAKQDKLNQFILDMHTLVKVGESKGLSITEYLLQGGQFPVAEINKMVAKYNANVSRFSQAEIIMRLASELGLVDVDGRERLEQLIRTIWPAGDLQKLDELGNPEVDLQGNPVKVKYAGADGSVQGLSTIGKDRLIFILQRMMVDSRGSKLDFSAEKTFRQLKTELQDASTMESFWKKSVALVKHFMDNGSSLISTTKSGKELAYRLQQMSWKETLMKRDWPVKILMYQKHYSKSDTLLQHITDVVQGRVQPANQMDLDYLDLRRQMYSTFAQDMELHQVQILYKNGAKKFFKFDPDLETHFPHFWEDTAFNNPSDKMIQSLIDSNEAADKKAALVLIHKFNNRRLRVSKFANMEMARETDLAGWIEDPFKVDTLYLNRAANRLAVLKQFGSTPEIALAQHALRHFQESKDPESFQNAVDLINEMTGTRVDAALTNHQKFGLSVGSLLATGTLLTYTSLMQPGVLNAMGMRAGYLNLVRGIAKTLPALWGNLSAMERVEKAKLAGVLTFNISKELYDVVLDDKYRERTDRVARMFGITQMDGALRLVGGVIGSMYGEDIALAYSQKQTPKLFHKLVQLGLDPKSIEGRVKQPGVPILTQEELRLSALAFTEDTNFVVNPMTTPVFLKNHPWGRIFFLFKRFVFMQHHFWMGQIKNDKMSVLKGLPAGTAIGAPLAMLIMLLQGDDPEKVLKKDGIAKFLWRSFAVGGGVGLFFEALGSAAMGLVSDTPQGSRSGLDTPVFGLADKLLAGPSILFKTVNKPMTDQQEAKLWESSIAWMQTTALLAPSRLGVPTSAAIGVAKAPFLRSVAPTKRQKETSYLQ